jgi:hypothetical protein
MFIQFWSRAQRCSTQLLRVVGRGAYGELLFFRRVLWSTVAALVAVLLQNPSLIAAPSYRVWVDSDSDPISNSTEVHLSVATYGGQHASDFLIVDEYGNYSYSTGFGRAGPAGLRASSHADVYLPDIRRIDQADTFTSRHTEAAARFRLNDVVISGPGTDPVPASLILQLDGHVSANEFEVNGGQTSASATVDLLGVVGSGSNFFRGYMQIGSSSSLETGGILSGSTGVGEMTITSPEYLLPVNTPFLVLVELETDASAYADSQTGEAGLPMRRFAEAASSFTFRMLAGRPLFNLPDGYTVNSQEGGIVDNTWTTSPADIDFSGTVDRSDAALFIQSFGRQSDSATGDINFDAATTLHDLAILQAHLGEGVANSPLSPAQPIPEPQSIALVVLAALAIAHKWRRRRSLRS